MLAKDLDLERRCIDVGTLSWVDAGGKLIQGQIGFKYIIDEWPSTMRIVYFFLLFILVTVLLRFRLVLYGWKPSAGTICDAT